jgi:CheY-like chemotaxis protein
MSAALPAPRVLLVDDNHGFRHELRLLLEDCGIEVVAEGENGVVLMDLRMPVMDGLEAARALRDRAPALPVIILSAYEDPP